MCVIFTLHGLKVNSILGIEIIPMVGIADRLKQNGKCEFGSVLVLVLFYTGSSSCDPGRVLTEPVAVCEDCLKRNIEVRSLGTASSGEAQYMALV